MNNLLRQVFVLKDTQFRLPLIQFTSQPERKRGLQKYREGDRETEGRNVNVNDIAHNNMRERNEREIGVSV